MKLLFAGTTAEAAFVLEQLLADSEFSAQFQIPLVLTTPDSPSGRNRKLTPSFVKLKATELGAKYGVTDVDDLDSAISLARELGVELALVVAYGKLLKQHHLDALKFGWVNLHFSLLPRWRGAAPVQRAVEAGDSETGVSVFQITAGLDEGPIFVAEKVSIGEAETSSELLARLAKIGVGAIESAVRKVAQGEVGVAQDELPEGSPAKYARKLDKADARIDWVKSPEEIVRHINAYSTSPGAWFELAVPGSENQRIVALKARVNTAEESGVELLIVKPAGKASMDAKSWYNGLRNYPSYKFV